MLLYLHLANTPSVSLLVNRCYRLPYGHPVPASLAADQFTSFVLVLLDWRVGESLLRGKGI